MTSMKNVVKRRTSCVRKFDAFKVLENAVQRVCRDTIGRQNVLEMT